MRKAAVRLVDISSIYPAIVVIQEDGLSGVRYRTSQTKNGGAGCNVREFNARRRGPSRRRSTIHRLTSFEFLALTCNVILSSLLKQAS